MLSGSRVGAWFPLLVLWFEQEKAKPVLFRSRTPAPQRRTPLYAPADLKRKKEITERERLQIELEGCTFKPTLERSSSVPPRRPDGVDSSEPVHERLQKYGRVVQAKVRLLGRCGASD